MSSDSRSFTDDPQWAELRLLLRDAEDDQMAMWDPDEIHAALEQANSRGISPKVVLACWESCRSQGDFQSELTTLIQGEKCKKRILAIDDEVAFGELLKMNLEKAGGYEVATESDSSKALERARSFKPDLVILDIVMPGIHGPELAKQLRADPTLSQVPILMLTSLMEGSETGGVTCEGILHLSKPIRIKKLIYCIEQHLNPEGVSSAAMSASGRFDSGT